MVPDKDYIDLVNTAFKDWAREGKRIHPIRWGFAITGLSDLLNYSKTVPYYGKTVPLTKVVSLIEKDYPGLLDNLCSPHGYAIFRALLIRRKK